MSKPLNTQSQKRYEDSLASLFHSSEGKSERNIIFLKSSTDEGVIRNGGRNGARLAPASFLATFKKLNRVAAFSNTKFKEVEVSNPQLEISDFDLAQSTEAKKISEIIKSDPKSWIYHLGGGHDHAYPFLSALAEQFEKIVVINIDAHADTRIDDHSHSGTPFRQFSETFKGEFFLLQVGLHPFANSNSTLKPLSSGHMEIIWKTELKEKLPLISQMLKDKVTDKTAVFFSIDADALEASIVPGVSAVNGDGITLNELKELWQVYRSLPLPHSPLVGIYELNPVYDTLASLSMRGLGSFVYESLI